MKFKVTEADKKKWGPYCWYLLHMIAYKCRGEDMDREIRFFSKLHKIIPCPKCKDHYKEWINKNPLNKNPDLVNWVIACHNNVNKFANKPILSESEVHDLFFVKDHIYSFDRER